MKIHVHFFLHPVLNKLWCSQHGAMKEWKFNFCDCRMTRSVQVRALVEVFLRERERTRVATALYDFQGSRTLHENKAFLGVNFCCGHASESKILKLRIF